MYGEIQKMRKKDVDAEFKEVKNPLDVALLPSKSDPISIKIQGLSGIRNREDFPNYLLNRELNSAHYDPKSRLMKDNPTPDLPEDQQVFKGHGSYQKTGEQLNL